MPATPHRSSPPLPISSICVPLPVHARIGAPPSPHPVCTGREGQRRRWLQSLCSLSCSAKQGQGRGVYLCVLPCIPHLRTEVG